MVGLAGEDLLTAWERTRALPEQQAALALLALAGPEQPREEWALLPLGERNMRLLELRAATLGARLEGFAECPACGAQLEFTVNVEELACDLRAGMAAAATECAAAEMRPANTFDLMALEQTSDAEEARALLLARAAGVDALDPAAAMSWLAAQPEEAAERLAERFERVNAAAEIQLAMECAACHSRPELDLNLARYLVREIQAAARRLLAEIHELAQAYGWSEAAIAAMSPLRRTSYLEMLGG